jgi:hypothetical protein
MLLTLMPLLVVGPVPVVSLQQRQQQVLLMAPAAARRLCRV